MSPSDLFNCAHKLINTHAWIKTNSEDLFLF